MEVNKVNKIMMAGEPNHYSESWYVKGKNQASNRFGCMNCVRVTKELVMGSFNKKGVVK